MTTEITNDTLDLTVDEIKEWLRTQPRGEAIATPQQPGHCLLAEAYKGLKGKRAHVWPDSDHYSRAHATIIEPDGNDRYVRLSPLQNQIAMKFDEEFGWGHNWTLEATRDRITRWLNKNFAEEASI